MHKAIKKGAEVKYVQWTGRNIEEVMAFFQHHLFFTWRLALSRHKNKLLIHTFDSVLIVNKGEYLIKETGRGSIYPMLPGIFEATYDRVND